MSKKKILWILLLILIIVAVVAIIAFARPKEAADSTETNTLTGASTVQASNKQYTKTELADGTLYSTTGEEVESDLVIGTDYFDTTINDIYLNPSTYENKNIEIEGMYLVNDPYTFVGRYSTSNICPYCPTGYSYMEYQLGGEIDASLTDEDSWIKVIGTLQKGNDETSGYQDYYYLDVASIEVMKEKGQDTVNN